MESWLAERQRSGQKLVCALKAGSETIGARFFLAVIFSHGAGFQPLFLSAAWALRIFNIQHPVERARS
jgi:hypothetical protein